MTKVNQSLNRELYKSEATSLPCLDDSCFEEAEVPPKEVPARLEPELLKTPVTKDLYKLVFAVYVPGVRANLEHTK